MRATACKTIERIGAAATAHYLHCKLQMTTNLYLLLFRPLCSRQGTKHINRFIEVFQVLTSGYPITGNIHVKLSVRSASLGNMYSRSDWLLRLTVAIRASPCIRINVVSCLYESTSIRSLTVDRGLRC